MPNTFTRVPVRPVPPLGPAARLCVPVADAFMVLMLSRPSTRSLRTTWVTPATLGLAVALTLILAAAAVELIVSGTILRVIIGAILLVAAMGPLAVSVVGTEQRLR
ncbi:MAG: hypothetical protein JOZ46_09845 [Candidatus Dormibacteraeota bacterium]|nr:hypothetical protein [Candidatus Dormibacteraeota bacterium]MBV9526099.1 hypothetical protein [Candidatus Dormibacteraeota bacterium]